MKVFNVDTETPQGLAAYQAHFKPDSPLFEAIEAIFDGWIRGEYEEMYFGEEAIYTKKGAIDQAIQQIFDYMRDENLPFVSLDDANLDLECSFE